MVNENLKTETIDEDIFKILSIVVQKICSIEAGGLKFGFLFEQKNTIEWFRIWLLLADVWGIPPEDETKNTIQNRREAMIQTLKSTCEDIEFLISSDQAYHPSLKQIVKLASKVVGILRKIYGELDRKSSKENDKNSESILIEDTAKKLGNIILVDLGHNGALGQKEQEILRQHLLLSKFISE